VHLAAIGHPVVGDDTYGDRPGRFGLDRPFLHATRLAFGHPTSGEQLEFEEPLPEALSRVLEELRAGDGEGGSGPPDGGGEAGWGSDTAGRDRPDPS
jgi:23S rRNA pseudouridine1911/1915/1917 synthase